MSTQAQFRPGRPGAQHGRQPAPGSSGDPVQDLRQDYAIKLQQYRIRKADAEHLQNQLEDANAAILELGVNTENVNQVRMLQLCLLQARRHLEITQQELALVQLRIERARAASAAAGQR